MGVDIWATLLTRNEMLDNRKLILTFDYELFLGRDTGTAQKTIIEPTKKILAILSQYKAHGIFFIDATYLLTLKKFNHPDFREVQSQIRCIVEQGNNVELHLHPQWLDAEPLDTDRWHFKSFDHFRLHSLSDRELGFIFSEGKEIIEKCAQQVNRNYTVNAFRAGGWSIAPFERIRPCFIQENIEMDFSVVPGMAEHNLPLHSYDFKKAPTSQSLWEFDTDPCQPMNGKNLFIEVPVTTYVTWGYNLIFNKLALRNKKNFVNGEGIRKSKVPKMSKLFQIIRKVRRSFSIDYNSNTFFVESLKLLPEQNAYVVCVSHPKAFTSVSECNLIYLLRKYPTLSKEEFIDRYNLR